MASEHNNHTKGSGQAETRGEMVGFWIEHSAKADEEEMMLDSQAAALSEHEVPEILGLLPDVKARDVLELGAGIGRFTGLLGRRARSVLAVDFIEKFIRKNEEEHGHLPNVSFRQADVTRLDLPPNSVDVIFSNWLLMYLTDEETLTLFNKMLSWLRDGGFLFFRESCFHQSGDKDRTTNPTRYRLPADYNALLAAARAGERGFHLVRTKSVQTYIDLKNNRNQLCWLVQKLAMAGDGGYHGYKTFQEFLDNQQYSRVSILRYEKIFGRDFISTGGRDTTEEFVAALELKAGEKVLDVGSGIGGSAFYMAKECDVRVHGLDLSANMVEIALERAHAYRDSRVQFEVADATKVQFPAGSFDVIYSRDTILHIEDKLALFKAFWRWLRPGGRLLISDYCCSAGEWSNQYAEYVAGRGYHLLAVPAYAQVLEAAGFTITQAQDRTDLFVASLEKELGVLQGIKEDFIKEFSAKDYEEIEGGWQDKRQRCALGDQRWGYFFAVKPAESALNGSSAH